MVPGGPFTILKETAPVKTALLSVLLSLAASLAFAEAVILKSGERYIGDVTEEGDAYRVKNATFPDGILVKKDAVKTIYPKPETLLDKLTKQVDAAAAKYEEAKKASDPNTLAKAAMDMLFDPELEAAEATEVYPSHKTEFSALTTRMHELRKLCRDAQNLGGKSPADPVKPPPADPKSPPTPAEAPKDAPKKTPPNVSANEMTAALETIKSGSASDVVATLAKFDDGKEERVCPAIIERLKSETDAQAKAALKATLSKFAGFVVIRTVENALKSKGVTDEFRRDCADVLSTKKDDKAVSMLTDLAFASDMKEVREHARGLLAEAENACLKSVNRYIHHPDARTRVDAVEFVARIGTPESYGILAQCLILGTSQELMKAASIDVPLRDLVVEKMTSGGDAACPALVAALSDGRLRKWSCFCLQKISGEGYAESDLKSWSAWWRKRQAELKGK
jgi:hypothetical protein